MIDDDVLANLTRLAHRIVISWADIDPRDLTQQLCMWWLENPETVANYLDSGEHGQRKLAIRLNREATNWCRNETTAIRGHGDYHAYTTKQVRDLLPLVFSPEAFGSLSVQGDGTGRSHKPASEGGEALAVYADLRSAWGRLTGQEQALLAARWVAEDPGAFDLLEAETGIPAAVWAKRCSRALAHITKMLAGRPLYGDRRRVQSNASAMSATARDY